MTPFAAVLLLSVACAQPSPNGDPSPTVQQQQKQADYARKGHQSAGKPQKQEPAALRTQGSAAKSSRKPKPGEAAIRTQK